MDYALWQGFAMQGFTAQGFTAQSRQGPSISLLLAACAFASACSEPEPGQPAQLEGVELATEPSAGEPASPLMRLAGSFVVVDASGEAGRAEEGSFLLALRNGNRADRYQVDFVEGAWAFERQVELLPRSIGVHDLVLDGREAVCLGPSMRIQVPADGRLDLRAGWRLERYEQRLSGTLYLPAEWELSDFDLILASQEPESPDALRARLVSARWLEDTLRREIPMGRYGDRVGYSWSVRDAPSGTYALTVPQTGYWELLEVKEDRVWPRIDVPLPGQVRLRLIDEENPTTPGIGSLVRTVDWGYMPLDAVLPSQLPVKRSGDLCEFRAPCGRLVIRAFGAIHDKQIYAQIVPGMNEIEMNVRRRPRED